MSIGIDLGSANTRIGVFRNGKFDLIEYDCKHEIPFYVAFTDTNILFGNSAKNEAFNNPQNVIFDIKHLIGRTYDDPVVQAGIEYWPFVVKDSDNRPAIEINYQGKTVQFFPEKILLMFLAKLKEIAEVSLNEPVQHAVITVPVSFNSTQRRTIINTGEVAGLKILQIINKPMAAAIAYRWNKIEKDEKHVLVFHLGSGSLDISLFEMKDNFIEAISTVGDPIIGGKTFDQCLSKNLIEIIKLRTGINLKDNNLALYRLLKAVEEKKILLSTSSFTSIKIGELLEEYRENMAFSEITITRDRFEDLCASMFQATMEHVRNAIQDAHLDVTNIQDVVFVGGSTLIPKVKELFQKCFHSEQLCVNVPEEAAAFGAAIQAAILLGDSSGVSKNIVSADVTATAIGIKIFNGLNNIIIKRNASIPAKEIFDFQVNSVNEPILIEIFEGEHRIAEKNQILGKYLLTTVNPMKAKILHIELVFNIDENGVFSLTFEECSHENIVQIKEEINFLYQCDFIEELCYN